LSDGRVDVGSVRDSFDFSLYHFSPIPSSCASQVPVTRSLIRHIRPFIGNIISLPVLTMMLFIPPAHPVQSSFPRLSFCPPCPLRTSVASVSEVSKPCPLLEKSLILSSSGCFSSPQTGISPSAHGEGPFPAVHHSRFSGLYR
jgi:hypothetical protein